MISDSKNFVRNIIKRKTGSWGEKPTHHATTLAFTFPPLHFSLYGLFKKKFSIKDAEYFMGLGFSSTILRKWLALDGDYCFKHE